MMMGRIFWKILLTFWLTLLIAGITAGLTVWLHQRDGPRSDDDLMLRPGASLAVQSAASTLRFGGVAALAELLQDQLEHGPAPLRVYAVDSAGQELLGRPVGDSALARARLLTQDLPAPQAVRRVSTGTVEFLLFVPRPEQTPASGRGGRRPPPQRSGQVLLFSGLLVSFVSSALLAWYFARPLRLLRSALGGLAAGDLSRRIGRAMGRRRDELADLARDFDHTAAQLQRLMESQRLLLHDVSHELRSPLARLTMSIGLARQQPEKTTSSLDRIEQEVARLDQLVGEILTLSRLEAGVANTSDEYLDLVELLEAVIDATQYEAQALQRKVVFARRTDGALIMRGHGELLYRAMENVVRNAVAHTPEHTAVNVSVGKQQAWAVIAVEDQGPGVSQESLAAIFDAFQSGGPSPSGQGGIGLGLAIAKRAVESHGGTISAENRPEGGLCMRICLPIPLEAPATES